MLSHIMHDPSIFSCTGKIADLQELIELHWYPSVHNCIKKLATLVIDPENGLKLRLTHQLGHFPNSESYDLFVLVLHDLKISAVASCKFRTYP